MRYMQISLTYLIDDRDQTFFCEGGKIASYYSLASGKVVS
jgi:hypothetical protein